jgi:REP element-mobilizing transposase RayT
MPRLPRPQFPGAMYHVGTRGNRRCPIYLDARDREYFLALLETIVRALGWKIHAYCLMGNHYHLLVETPNGDIARGMEWLNGRYARWFNARRGFVGHLFERRYFEELIESEQHLLEVARYIETNPLRAGLVVDPADWPWSSYRAIAGLERPRRFLSTAWILGHFGRDLEVARVRYERFVRDAPARVRSP